MRGRAQRGLLVQDASAVLTPPSAPAPRAPRPSRSASHRFPQGEKDRFVAALMRRLDLASDAPLGIALSGGGDSLALLLLTAEQTRRPLVAFVVDHGLHPGSAAWTRFACAAAERAGATPVPLRWTGDKPAAGLPSAARRARHALIAEAARARDCAVVLFGHTADDLAEAAAMRAAGSTVGDPADWAPSPVWPEGRGVFLLRPLLGVSRKALRGELTARGESWLEDPANTDPRFARARARRNPLPLEGGEGRARGWTTASTARADHPHSQPFPPPGGRESWLVFDRAALSPAVLARALVCASGGERFPGAEAARRLVRRLQAGEDLAATLAGARLQARGDTVLIVREPGRAGLPILTVSPGETAVWDGRYAVTAADDRSLTVRALAGLAARLSPADRARLRDVPALARPSLPVVDGPDGPVLATNLPGARCLVSERLRSSCGLIAHEREIAVPRRGAVNVHALC